jgi:hypothetical protein
MGSIADIFSDPLVADEQRSMTQILAEDHGITHRRAPGGGQILTGPDGVDLGVFRIHEAMRWVRDRRTEVRDTPDSRSLHQRQSYAH